MIAIIKTDFRNILRDPSLIMISMVPLVMLALLRWGYPALQMAWVEIEIYRHLILATFCITGAIMPGIALAFAMLDEKDQNIDNVLRILPLSYLRIVISRVAVIFIFGFVSALLFLLFSGIERYHWLILFSLSLLSALMAPVIGLATAYFASNKIEGATITKALNFLILLPLPAFLFPGSWNWFLAVFPAWWIFLAFESTHLYPMFVAGITGGIIFHLILILFLIRLMKKRYMG
jgi:fluoroquinolone transport system permease protein